MGPAGFDSPGLVKVDDYPLYVLKLEGDIGFSEYLRTGILNFSFDGGMPSCTCFDVAGNGCEPVFGRNFDFPRDPAFLLFTDPQDGYTSVSMVDLGYFGYSISRLPTPKEDLVNLRMTPYLLFNGMNKHGLAGDDLPTDPLHPGRPLERLGQGCYRGLD